jgi:hypothetical protein
MKYLRRKCLLGIGLETRLPDRGLIFVITFGLAAFENKRRLLQPAPFIYEERFASLSVDPMENHWSRELVELKSERHGLDRSGIG